MNLALKCIFQYLLNEKKSVQNSEKMKKRQNIKNCGLQFSTPPRNLACKLCKQTIPERSATKISHATYNTIGGFQTLPRLHLPGYLPALELQSSPHICLVICSRWRQNLSKLSPSCRTCISLHILGH